MSLHGVGRRAFLRGAGGAALSLPFLSMFAGKASAQAKRPKRLVILFHPQGTINERWQPANTGALSATLPSLLEPLTPFRDRLNVLSGIDNLVRYTMSATNGHNGAARSILTCQPFQGVKQGSQPDNGAADGPSFDWVLGPKLKGDAPRAVINLGVRAGGLAENTVFWQSSGQSAGIDGDPREAMTKLFSNVGGDEPLAQPTPAEIFRQRRGSVLDTVLDGYKRLVARAPSEDRQRLEAHAQQVRALEALAGGVGGGAAAASACSKPNFAGVFPGDYDPYNTRFDDASSRAQIENTVMALACDITRVVSIQYVEYQYCNFAWMYGGDTGAAYRGASTYPDWHNMVHLAAQSGDAQGVANLARGYVWYSEQMATLLRRLAETEDGPGQTLLDNTLVLSISEFGNASAHWTLSLPVLLAGNLGGQVRTGQHLDCAGYSTGDLYTTLQEILTGDGTPFGMTGPFLDQAGIGLAGRPFHTGFLPGLG